MSTAGLIRSKNCTLLYKGNVAPISSHELIGTPYAGPLHCRVLID